MKRGRPPLDQNDHTVNVNVCLPSKQYDEAFQIAQRQRLSVPEVIRRALKAAADKHPTE